MGLQRECTRILGVEGFRVERVEWESESEREPSVWPSVKRDPGVRLNAKCRARDRLRQRPVGGGPSRALIRT